MDTKYDHIKNFIKDNFKIISIILLVFSCVSVFVFAQSSVKNVTFISSNELFERVSEQSKGNNSWLSDKGNREFAEILNLMLVCQHSSKLLLDVTITGIGENGIPGKIAEKVLEYKKKQAKSEYKLYTIKGEVKKDITMKVFDNLQLSFYDNDKQLSFNLDKKVFDTTFAKRFNQDEIQNYVNNLVLAYTDDPDTVSIDNGIITGKQAGKTVLHVFKNGWLFNYKVIINPQK